MDEWLAVAFMAVHEGVQTVDRMAEGDSKAFIVEGGFVGGFVF